ncbi:hypothetical protein HMPREF0388_1833 [Mobiluncus curtisii ATCC 51333]|uniref:Uncharacterized protein n=1 Tax=Mobiluncus curtisii ATCC 51333 TaxID=887326 RepID=E6LZX0_9ACTO|nr:hypothetical protein HMPREF0388_1833 [Mobiluncus curtisii ATCC 51333]
MFSPEDHGFLLRAFFSKVSSLPLQVGRRIRFLSPDRKTRLAQKRKRAKGIQQKLPGRVDNGSRYGMTAAFPLAEAT